VCTPSLNFREGLQGDLNLVGSSKPPREETLKAPQGILRGSNLPGDLSSDLPRGQGSHSGVPLESRAPLTRPGRSRC
jgi:hypothetical protein